MWMRAPTQHPTTSLTVSSKRAASHQDTILHLKIWVPHGGLKRTMPWILRICLGLFSFMTTDFAYAGGTTTANTPINFGSGQIYELVQLDAHGNLTLRARGTGRVVRFNIGDPKTSPDASTAAEPLSEPTTKTGSNSSI